MSRKVFELMTPMTKAEITAFIQEQMTEGIERLNGVGATLCEVVNFTNFDLKNPVYEPRKAGKIKIEWPEDLFIRMVDGQAQRYSVVRYTQYLGSRINGEYLTGDELIAAWDNAEACDFERRLVQSLKEQAKFSKGSRRLGKAWFDFRLETIEFVLMVQVADAEGFQAPFTTSPTSESVKVFTLPLREFYNEWDRSGRGFSQRISALLREGMTFVEAIEAHYESFKDSPLLREI